VLESGWTAQGNRLATKGHAVLILTPDQRSDAHN
jgi:hypothetical protein